MNEFKSRIPDLAQSLSEHIAEAHKKNRKFREAFATFVTLCRASLNPDLSDGNVDEMLIQHLLTERLMRNKLDPYYNAIERQGANLSHFTEKQDFLNSVYEQFFQRFSPSVADTHGIVYTPREIVDYMCSSVEQALKEEFGYTLASPEVVILGPQGQQLYRGRVDNRFVDLGKTRYQPTESDLQEALDAIMQGKAVPHPVTQTIGCAIPGIS